VLTGETLDITSNSLKDIVPDLKPLLSKDQPIEEDDVKVSASQNGKNGNNSDDEIGPSLPLNKISEDTVKFPRKKIRMEDDPEVSNVLLIMNLSRPFTVPQLKQMLQRTGTIEDFWINKVKSRCCTKFQTVDQASETRMALNGVTWPQGNKNPLHVVFSTEDNLERLRNSVDEQPARVVTTNGTRLGATRDWDKEKLHPRDRDVRPQRERSEEKMATMPSKSLEELFNKTKSQPSLYWKPLSEEVIARKEEARNKRVLAALQKKKSRSRSHSR